MPMCKGCGVAFESIWYGQEYCSKPCRTRSRWPKGTVQHSTVAFGPHAPGPAPREKEPPAPYEDGRCPVCAERLDFETDLNGVVWVNCRCGPIPLPVIGQRAYAPSAEEGEGFIWARSKPVLPGHRSFRPRSDLRRASAG